jgi:hypothetical protein
MAVVDSVRIACADVAKAATHVSIDDAQLIRYADGLHASAGASDKPPPGADRSERAAFTLCVDAINFGSGWFPTLRKAPGASGYGTVTAGLRARLDRDGVWPPGNLAEISGVEVAEMLGQDPEHELMALYAGALREVGRRIIADFDGDWVGVVDAANGSAVELVEMIASWPGWHDVSPYGGRDVPFFKRAQILAADLARAGVARFTDLGRLTMFADNLVPHVLRMDGVLIFEPALTARIEAGELLEHGSPQEVEIRACALHAVERLIERSPGLAAYQLDELLWERGGKPRYKAVPRHRARCTAY